MEICCLTADCRLCLLSSLPRAFRAESPQVIERKTITFGDYKSLLGEIRSITRRELALLREEWKAQSGDTAKSISMWRIALLTGVSEGAMALCESSQYRAARILDRSLSEYAYRLHHYMRHPERAEIDAEQYRNYLRKILKPIQDVRGDMTDERFETFPAFLAEGGTSVRYHTTRGDEGGRSSKPRHGGEVHSEVPGLPGSRVRALERNR
jgi:hypothetical protein